MNPRKLLRHKALLEDYLGRTPGDLSGFSFVSLFAWQQSFDFEFEIIHDNLCVFARHAGALFLYLPPLGPSVNPETVEEVFQIMEKANRAFKSRGLSRIENASCRHLAAFDEARYASYKRGEEYCYFKDELVALAGNAFKSKRSSYNRFLKNHRFMYQPYRDEMLNDCAALYDQWAGERRLRHRDEVYQAMLDENRSVHRLVLGRFRRLNLTGRVVTVDGRIRAYTFGYPVNDHMFCVFLEVADLSVKGLPVFLFRHFCADPFLRQYRLINCMDDSFLENLRQTKLSFRPRMTLPVYTITRK